MVGGLGGKDDSFLWAGCWIAVMGEVGKDSYQHGPPSQVMWGVNFGWIQESVYLCTNHATTRKVKVELRWVVDVL